MEFCNFLMYLWLIFRYQINDKLAFPLLLRGLEHTDNWTTLKRVELKDDIATPDILNPEVNYCFLLKVSSCLTKLTFFLGFVECSHQWQFWDPRRTGICSLSVPSGYQASLDQRWLENRGLQKLLKIIHAGNYKLK